MTLATIENTTFSLELAELVDRAREAVAEAKAPATLRAYAADWRHFTDWAVDRALPALPASPQTVALYLTDLADRYKASTLQRRLSSISQAHQAAGFESPTKELLVRTVFTGLKRRGGHAFTAQVGKRPAVTEDVVRMVAGRPPSLLGTRDRALLLVGFAGAFRRSELVALDVEDLEDDPKGLVVLLRRSKTDQEGHGRKVGLPFGSTSTTCPVRSLQAWLTAAGISSGPIFRRMRNGVPEGRLSGQSVALVVKRAADDAGLDPALYAGHSLRAGLATSAAAAGASERAIMRQTGHRSLPMVRRYIRDGNLFRDNAAGVVGL